MLIPFKLKKEQQTNKEKKNKQTKQTNKQKLMNIICKVENGKLSAW